MGILTEAASLADFKRLQIETVMKAGSESSCESRATEMCRLASEFEARRDGTAFAAAKLLAFLCCLRLHSDDPRDPLRAFPPLPLVDHLDDRDAQFLTEIQADVNHHDLRARIRDVLWLTKRDGVAAESAVDDYVQAAKLLSTERHLIEASDRLERALRLALSARKKNLISDIVHTAWELFALELEEASFAHIRLAELLLEARTDDLPRLAAELERIGSKAKQSKNFLLERRSLELCNTCFTKLNDTVKANAALMERVESFVAEADAYAGQSVIGLGAPVSLMQQAVKAIEKIPGARTRREELLAKLATLQAASMSQMVVSKQEVDLAEMAKCAREVVDDSDPVRSIYNLARFPMCPRKASLQEQVRQTNDRYIAQFLFATTMVNSAGRTTARVPTATPGQPEDSPSFVAQMHGCARQGRVVIALGFIEPARQHIDFLHRIRPEHLAQFVWDNPLIPSGREQLFLHGLMAGIRGDYVAASHILIPQIEHLIRELLTKRGVRTFNFDAEGIQDDHDLNTLLYNPELVAAIGDDLCFDLQGLLVNRFGSNLRNEIAHGLRSDDASCGPDVIYCWWLTLHLLSRVLVPAQAQPTPVPPDETAASATDG
jgi:hypothetical protein